MEGAVRRGFVEDEEDDRDGEDEWVVMQVRSSGDNDGAVGKVSSAGHVKARVGGRWGKVDGTGGE